MSQATTTDSRPVQNTSSIPDLVHKISGVLDKIDFAKIFGSGLETLAEKIENAETKEDLKVLRPLIDFGEMELKLIKQFIPEENEKARVVIDDLLRLRSKSPQELSKIISAEGETKLSDKILAGLLLTKKLAEEEKVSLDIVIGTDTVEKMMKLTNKFLWSREGKRFISKHSREILYPPDKEELRVKFQDELFKAIQEYDKKNGKLLANIGVLDPKALTSLNKILKEMDLPGLDIHLFYPKSTVSSYASNSADAIVNVLHDAIAVKAGFRSGGLASKVASRGSTGNNRFRIFERIYENEKWDQISQAEKMFEDAVEYIFNYQLKDLAKLNIQPQYGRDEEEKSRVVLYTTKKGKKVTYVARELEKFDQEIPTLFGTLLEPPKRKN